MTIPDNWTAKRDRECTTFTSDASASVLQISAYEKGGGEVTEEEIVEFATSDQNRNRLRRILNNGASGLYDEHCDADDFWREWWIAKRNVLVYITCIVPERLKDHERALIEEIVASLK